MLKVFAHPDDFLPLYNQLKINPQKNKAMLEALDNVKQQLENSDNPLGANHKKSLEYFSTIFNQHFTVRVNHQSLYQ
jgi:hypothetical protein